MLRKVKQVITAFLVLNKSEQRGILLLVIFIVAVGIINLSIPVFINKNDHFEDETFRKEIEKFVLAQQQAEDSVRIERLQNRGELSEELALQKLKPFPFNPNHFPEEAWAEIGLTKKQIQTIKNYESKGGKFRKKEDLRNIYCISDAEYAVLEPYITIPAEYKAKAPQAKKKPAARRLRYFTTEINAADSSTLVRSLHLSPWIARRVIKYRNLLGGFFTPSQLTEVYGFDSVQYEKIRRYIRIDTALITKININESGFKEILRHPYISYDITKQIVNYRSQNGAFTSLDELTEADILSESLYIKLKPYLRIN